jgi:hypothetical protein
MTETPRHHGASKLRKQNPPGTRTVDVTFSLAIRRDGGESLTMAQAIVNFREPNAERRPAAKRYLA